MFIVILIGGSEASAFRFDTTTTEYMNQITSLTWTKQLIQNADTPSGLYAFDVDKDNKCDLLGTAYGSNTIFFWRNAGGNPITWEKHNITTSFTGACFVYPCDIDNDDDTDVLGAGWESGEIAWWRNDGGSPIVWAKQIIATDYPEAHEVFACDFESDGDFDVFAVSAELNSITWWCNEGGNPIVWVQQSITDDCLGARSVVVHDLDGDGDFDVVGAGFLSNDICWYRNDGGNPISWSKNKILSAFNGAHHVDISDIDQDGDPDIIGTAAITNMIILLRNDGGNPIVWTQQLIAANFFGALRIALHDIDLDGTIDCVGTAVNAGDVCWWSNDNSSPIIWKKNDIDISCTGAWPLTCADFDCDGDVDVAAGSWNAIYWYTNGLLSPGTIQCDDSLIWSKVKPNSVVTGSFFVENTGLNGLKACYEVTSWPSWGSWTFTPLNGVVMSGDQVEIEVSVLVPDEKNMDFSGEVTLVNPFNSSNTCVVPITLTTPIFGEMPYESERIADDLHQILDSSCKKTNMKWTWIFYNDADFSPGYDPFIDFSKEAYSGENLDVIMLQDSYVGPAKIWYIDSHHQAELLENLGEVNMGDYQTFKDFLKYCKQNYPADRYLLSVYDHGGGWTGACIDQTNAGWLTMDEMQQALMETDGVDIICFTAPCYMGAFESAYELRKCVDVYIGSEESSGYIVWLYLISDICDILETDSDINSISLGDQIINLIHEKWVSEPGLTMSAIRLDKIEKLANALDTVAHDFVENQERTYRNISFLHNHVQSFLNSDYLDLYDLIKKYSTVETDQNVFKDATMLLKSITDSVIAECHGSDYPNAHGLTIYFPEDKPKFNLNYSNITYGLDFSNATYWDEFLRNYFGMNMTPDKPTKPSGQESGKINTLYYYNTTTTDIENDLIYYFFDWGDGKTSGWLGPYSSGQNCTASHSWGSRRNYEIKVKAKDCSGLESVWSDPVPVTMPYLYNPIHQFFNRLFEYFPHAFPILRHLLGY